MFIHWDRFRISYFYVHMYVNEGLVYFTFFVINIICAAV